MPSQSGNLLAHWGATAMALGRVIGPVPVLDRRGDICREVLESLPEWFAIPASIESYVAAADELPMLACFGPSREVVGFVSLKTHTGLRCRGLCDGRQALLASPWNWPRLDRSPAQLAISQGVRFLTVKTLSPSNDDPYYERTRLFYEAVGFVPIEEFPTLWEPENPCIFMLRPISSL
jgi:hypothetical protein